MIAKKSKGADLEKKRFAFFQVGLITVSAMTLVAFEYAGINEEMALAERYEPGPLVSGTTTWDPQPADETAQNSPAIPEPNPGGSQIIDTVIIVSMPVDPGKGIYAPVDPVGSGGGTGGPPPPPVDPIIPEDAVVIIPDVEPSFPGGDKAMREFTVANINYPDVARDLGIEGTVYVEFVVNKDGSISEVVAKNKIDAELQREAIRLVKMMPNWIPGEQAGKPVRCRFIYPIRFSIN